MFVMLYLLYADAPYGIYVVANYKFYAVASVLSLVYSLYKYLTFLLFQINKLFGYLCAAIYRM